jgi:hypothetical protein
MNPEGFNRLDPLLGGGYGLSQAAGRTGEPLSSSRDTEGVTMTGKRRRFKRACSAAAALTAASTSVPIQHACAFNGFTDGSCGSVFTPGSIFYFQLSALVGPGPTVIPWNTTATGLFQDGAASWERLRNDANTAPVIDFESSTTDVGRWTILRGVPGSTNDINLDGLVDGQSACGIDSSSGQRRIQIASREDQPNAFRRTAVHETGHALGNSHTGLCDSRPVSGSTSNMHASTAPCTGQQPVGSTNCGSTSTVTTPTADDYAGLMYRRSGSGRQVTTNGGFESTQLSNSDVGQAWRGSYTVVTASPAQGARYGELANGAAIRQQALVLNPSTSGSPSTSQATVNARFKSSGTSNAKVVVRKRHITNAFHNACTSGDAVPGPWNPSVWNSVGPSIDVLVFQFNSGGNASAWGSLSTSNTVANASTNTSSIQLEVEVVNTTGGQLWVDNVSMQFSG